MLVDYGIIYDPMLVHCDNMSAINLSKNPVQHSRTKHVDIRHHFVRELVEMKIVILEHVPKKKQLADLFTKPLDYSTFLGFRKALGIEVSAIVVLILLLTSCFSYITITSPISHTFVSGVSTVDMQSSPSSVPSSSRIRQRRRSTPATPSPSAAPADGSHSAVSDEEVDNFLPKEPQNAASRQAAKRYKLLTSRKFVTQQRLPLADEKLHDVKKVVQKCGLIYTVIDSDSFQPNMVREFVANLHDAEDRDDGLAVYVRGALVDFSPILINAMYLIPGFEEDHDYMAEEIDGVCAFLTNNQVKRWENMSSKFLTPLNQVLYKLVCSNSIPTTNYTTITQDRLKFLYMIHHHKRFDFGKLVYN
ncbi:hypothetical protein N665_0707s0013 [Sinapis alba]|nr:hypothetical protein N665_0707s0013 [Sinapis alba]